jgi:hypothetical protein
MAVDYFAVAVYLHAFSATELERDVLLTATCDAERTGNEFEALRDNPERMDWSRKGSRINYGKRTSSTQTVC